jgi:hypothetical protein
LILLELGGGNFWIYMLDIFDNKKGRVGAGVWLNLLSCLSTRAGVWFVAKDAR